MRKIIEKNKLYTLTWIKDHRNRKFYVISLGHISSSIQQQVFNFMSMNCIPTSSGGFQRSYSSWKFKSNDRNEVNGLCTMLSLIAA